MISDTETSYRTPGTRLVLRSSCVSLLVIILELATLSACDVTRESNWQEEVRLPDGQVITVARKIVWKESRPMGQSPEYFAIDTSLSVVTNLADEFPRWHGSHEFPLLLIVNSNGYVLVTTPGSCSRHISAGRPVPSYLEYRLLQGVWTEVMFDHELIGTQSNILVDPTVLEHGLVTLEEKARRRSRLPSGLRELLSTWKRC